MAYVTTQSVKRNIQRWKFERIINIKLERIYKKEIGCGHASGGAGTVQNTRKEVLPLSHSQLT
jgi:hypothetical protein